MCVRRGEGGGRWEKDTDLRLSRIEPGFRSSPMIKKYIIYPLNSTK